ncbi:MAG: hypothetical protein JXQ71_03765 [Verrucomicrobia bacterium]|nr:hypothetical protein [Verrucomicrobiota bacterium]
MVRKARESTGEQTIHLVIGGFHLGGEPASRLESIAGEFRLMSVQKAAPCHCSGDEAREVFKKRYGQDYLESGAGTTITLPMKSS